MKNIEEYIASGKIEMYVLGLTSEEENEELARLSLIHPEIEDEIAKISEALISYAEPVEKINPDVKALLMATIDYTERLKNGEQPSSPPLLNQQSTKENFREWLDREDMIFDESYGDTYVKIIGYTPEAMTGIVWLKTGSAKEMHEKEYEKFLILEGSCTIETKEKDIYLVPGDYFAVPLYMEHTVVVTSEIPCKLILQRLAA